ncbi:probable UDP-arabinopyranose mutase 5 isoform X2 [Manihot esculenta]|uniref:probable UDP-arabinopyranose mutase 5 isoform X2 n=1 Tax=Manihot esculenta TaxID=3983 RepID=UPI000B5D8B2D|nr:probable UDP-arabinopyranose mutase 5 isoform X2 [Manihot esculenta]
MRTPPSLLSLAIDTAVLHLPHFSDLYPLPEHILLDLFLRTLKAGKLNEKVLNLFMATGKDEILSVIQALNIQHVLTPVLPTINIKDSDVDIVIGALNSDLTQFMNEWRSIFSQFHLIIVKDPDLNEELKIPEGFNIDVYTKSHMDQVVGSSTSVLFSGYSCRYFGFLISHKKYIVSIDDDCIPAKDEKGFLVDAVEQHIVNLTTPATPLFFNTLYDPYREGADFVRGYPFSLRNGVTCALSCGLWLNLADLDAPTQALKPGQRNSRYVDAVMTVPARAMMPISGINIAFNRELVGPTLLPALRLAGEGKLRWETMEDIWSGMCVKVVCDHLGLGVKSGLPYVWRKDRGNAIESLKKEWEGMKLMEEVVPFFQSVRLPQTAATAEDCVVEIANAVKQQLGPIDPVFSRAAEAMSEWVKLWKSLGSGSSSL